MLKKQEKKTVKKIGVWQGFLFVFSIACLSLFSFSFWLTFPSSHDSSSLARQSSEYNYFNTSPMGKSGGLAIPASCPSDLHDDPNYGTSCTTCNVCGSCNGGWYACGNVCSASAPPLPPNYGNACTSPANACGMTNSGSIGCSGCNAVRPDDSLCIDYRICPASATIGGAVPTFQFRAYYKTSGPINCASTGDATDVTLLVNWSSSAPGIATVNNGGSKGLVTRVALGVTNISVSNYAGETAVPAPVTVTCIPTINCSTPPHDATTANTCRNKNFIIDDGCGGTVICTGTRTCDFNWKEVSQ